MVGFTEASAIMSSIKAASDIAQSMVGLRDVSLVQSKVLEIQRLYIEAQQVVFSVNEERASLIDLVSDMKKEIARFETWSAEKKRYKLDEIQPGIFVYLLKTEEAQGEPIHCLCTTCYDNGKKSILQGQKLKAKGMETAKCHTCSSELKYFRSDLPSPPQALPRGPVRSIWMDR